MLKPLPQGRTYTLAVYIATLVFGLACAVLIAGLTRAELAEAISTMPAFATALGVVAGSYGAKATAQHFKGTVNRPKGEWLDHARAEAEADEPR